MPPSDALELLRAHDPARRLKPLTPELRAVMLGRIVASPARAPAARARRVRPLVLIGVALAAAVLAGGAAWAAGGWSPVSLFRENPQHRSGGSGESRTARLWDQRVIASSVVRAAAVALPRVGTVAFWYGDTTSHGWCGALRLPSGRWVGTGVDRLDAGGTVPGCFPTRRQVNDAGEPVYVIDGFDYQEGDVDARPIGGAFWRIRYGLLGSRHAVRVTDLASGRSARVVRGGLFALAVPDADPNGPTPLHLVAYDAAGRVVADEAHGSP
jgi:hypothetical protein